MSAPLCAQTLALDESDDEWVHVEGYAEQQPLPMLRPLLGSWSQLAGADNGSDDDNVDNDDAAVEGGTSGSEATSETTGEKQVAGQGADWAVQMEVTSGNSKGSVATGGVDDAEAEDEDAELERMLRAEGYGDNDDDDGDNDDDDDDHAGGGQKQPAALGMKLAVFMTLAVSTLPTQ